MIKIYQKEKSTENNNAKKVIDDLLKKILKIGILNDKSNSYYGNFDWFYDCRFYFLLWKLINA
jgi:hypothetical protein